MLCYVFRLSCLVLVSLWSVMASHENQNIQNQHENRPKLWNLWTHSFAVKIRVGLFCKIKNWCLYPLQFFSLWYKKIPRTFKIVIELNLRLLNYFKNLLKDGKFALAYSWSNFLIFQPILKIRVSRWGFLRFGKPLKHISEL